MYVLVNTNLNHAHATYNKNVRVNTYSAGDKTWLQNKTFKPGQSPKLATPAQRSVVRHTGVT